MNLFESLIRSGLSQALRTATRDTVHKKTSGRWECPNCGVMKQAQATKHEVNGSTICTKCKNKAVKSVAFWHVLIAP